MSGGVGGGGRKADPYPELPMAVPCDLGMVPFAVGTKVRFREPYRPCPLGCHRHYRRHGRASRAEFRVGLLGPCSLRRLHHAMDPGLAIGAGRLAPLFPVRPDFGADHAALDADHARAELAHEAPPLRY